MITLTIDGQRVEAEEGKTLLKVAKDLDIEIPTLCHHDAIPSVGACRVCLVEVKAGARPGLVPACTYTVQEGLEIETCSERALESRRMTLGMLKARCPNVKEIQEMAEKYGAEDLPLETKDDNCIMCGLCVRVCREVIGSAATCFSGRGVDREVTTPYKLLSDVCIGCGACAFVCPTGAVDPADYCKKSIEKISNEYNCGIDSRTPIHMPFPQAVPNKAVLDRDNCIYFATGKCGVCKTVCEADAIDFDTEDEIVQEEVGAIVVATGYELMDPSIYKEYGYGKYPDVVTSLEFERMVSASGPTNGKLMRPSDGKVPEKVVFIQCVGSRDESVGVPYCSGICCMYTAKHTMLFKHKVPHGKAFVFYIDVRASGKNYEQFIRRVTKEKKAIYLRGRVSKIFNKGDKLIVRGADTLSGGQVEIKADLVVLAAAIQAPKGAAELAQKLKISYDEFNFYSEAHPKLRPIETNTAGIFLAGTCQAPRDIPDTVAQASGAAAKVLGIIHADELEREPIIGVINENTCNGCFDCEKVCAYNAIEKNEIKDRQGSLIKVVARINEGLCQGCGACAASCRSSSIDVQGFTDDQVYAQILGG